ncbi:bile acid:sodium symporter [Streptomyces sp. SID8382]|uniref:bile acid:sodium symporter family protein n=1 Tax=Streptomyces malaysiensis TaxID=92644 RepID=UPI000C2CD747|nr:MULTISPECIES: bile acid:sodium symporter [unclassified Streptomyces]AUA08037.1 Sodium Bile acid symporter family protein [Streptomyces sp. M56]MYX63024.1 bile acid:sodium symporter [Streptomyces sp. SID8382]
MDTLHLVLNAVTVIFIAATMFTAGLGATMGALRAVFTNIPLLSLALITNMVVVPLLGWGIGTLFGLPSAAFIALVLVASSPGGPFGAKLAMVQKGDAVAGAAMQVLLASIGSLTFAPTANAILGAAHVGTNVSLDVGALVRTVALLQLVPFAIGLLIRRYATPTAQSWHPTAAAVSNVTFLIVLAGMLLGSWRHVVALFGSLALLAGFLLAALAFAAGTLLATGPTARRTTMGGVASVRNAGPALAAIGLAFSDQPAVLGALAAVLLSGLAAALPIATILSGRRTASTPPSESTDHGITRGRQDSPPSSPS